MRDRGRRKDRERIEAGKPGEVPAAFATLFRGVPEHQLGKALGDWLEAEYGSRHAYLYWLTTLATEADRETVRLDAVAKLITLLHGEAPQIIEVRKAENNEHAPPAFNPERLALVADIAARVGALPVGARASLARGSTHAEMEQVPQPDPRSQGR